MNNISQAIKTKYTGVSRPGPSPLENCTSPVRPADGALGYLLTERTLHYSRLYFAKTKNKNLSVALVKHIRFYDKRT